MDRNKFEKNMKSSVKFVTAYGIAEDIETSYPKEPLQFPNQTFRTVVPEVINSNNIDTLVMQAGSVEITNIKVNEALMDTSRDMEDYKKQWFEQVEEDSRKLFEIAEDAIRNKPDIKIVIVKRLPRYDCSSQDILGIKSTLSNYANSVYDQLWIKSGSPKNIRIAELQLNVEQPGYLRNLIFGSRSANSFDGIHLNGPGASRHFTYRAVQAIGNIISPHDSKPSARSKPYRQTEVKYKMSKDDHSDCPQVRHQRLLQSKYDHTDCPQTRHQQMLRSDRSYSDAVRGYTYSIPTMNRFNPLN